MQANSLQPDADGDGDVDEEDLEEFGVASKVVEVEFSINPNA